MRITLVLFTFAALAAPAGAAERNYSVTDFDRIRVEGPYAVTLVTNVAPFAKASGSQRAIEAIALRVEGRTLIIQLNRAAWGGDNRTPMGPVTIAVGTHGLSSASLGGTGSLSIDKVRGLEFALTVVGAGQGSIANAQVDRLKLAVAGSGTLKAGGKTGTLIALSKGTATLDTQLLSAKDVTLVAQGPAVASIVATNSAKIDAAGTSVVTVSGNAACTLKVLGSATVTGCR